MIETTTLGRDGPVVSRVGLGLMGMSGIYGRADDAESLATIRAAVARWGIFGVSRVEFKYASRDGTPTSPSRRSSSS